MDEALIYQLSVAAKNLVVKFNQKYGHNPDRADFEEEFRKVLEVEEEADSET